MKRNDLYSILHTILLLAICIITFFLNNRTIFFGKESYEVAMTHRLIAAASATIFIFFCYLLGKEISRREDFAWIAALLLCTSYRFILFGRIPSDVLCSHAAMAGALFFMFCTFKEHQGTYLSAILGGLCLGLSYLSNQWLSFFILLLPFCIVFLLFYRPIEWRRWRQILIILAITLFMTCIPYLHFDFMNNEPYRYIFGKKCLLWTTGSHYSWSFYIPILWSMGAWTFLFLISLLLSFWTKQLKDKQTYLSAFVWLLLQFVLISAAPQKDINYLLPLMLPTAYLMSSIVVHWKESLGRRSHHLAEQLFLINSYALSAICLLLPIIGYWLVYRAGYMIFDRYLLLSIYTFIISGCLFIASWKRIPYFIIYSLTALLCVGEVMM
jgi:4-amino-4-deoxy-L-arabinose transferase and related glycosyltransferases of PMT family